MMMAHVKFEVRGVLLDPPEEDKCVNTVLILVLTICSVHRSVLTGISRYLIGFSVSAISYPGVGNSKALEP